MTPPDQDPSRPWERVRAKAAWIRMGVGVAAVGYALVAVLRLQIEGPFAPRTLANLGVTAACLAAFLISRARPVTAAVLTLVTIWTQLIYAVGTVGTIQSTSLVVLPVLVAATALFVGGLGALVAAAACCAGVPAVLWLSGAWEAGLTREDRIWLLIYEVVVVAAALLSRSAMAAYEDALARSEESRRRYLELFDQAPDALVATDRAGLIVQANPAARALLGRAPVGDRFSDVLGPAAGAVLADRDGGALPLEVAVTGPGGVQRILEASARQGGHEGTHELWILRDVTQRKAFEQHLGHAQRLEMVGQLAGGIAHDFNNLLTVIGGNASLLNDHADAEVREMAETILAAQRAGATLTRQLLTFGRRDVARPETVDLGEVLAGMNRLLDPLLGEQHRVALDRGGGACVEADRAQLEQLVINLVTNARDAMPAGGEIRVAYRCLTPEEARTLGSSLGGVQQVLLEVADKGVGMAPGVSARVFEPFFTTKPRGKGTGLGLATVHGIVQRSQGAVFIDTAPGQGTRFRVFFPRAGKPPAGSAPVPQEVRPTVHRKRILVAEDEESVRSLVDRVLSRAGHEVVVTGNAAEALKAYDTCGPFDLVLTDMAMPGASGPELARSLRARDPAPRILFMTGYFRTPDGEMPPSDSLPKPFTPSELNRAVDEVFGTADSG